MEKNARHLVPLELLRAYMWGDDLSGTPQGAGGVGGLIMIKEHDLRAVRGGLTPHAPALYAPIYDFNGNILSYWEMNRGEGLTHSFKYDAFGRELTRDVLEASGDTSPPESPPFKFSTKYDDEETGLAYYGYRYYSAEMGRWLNKDPTGEAGGLNLYAMVRNNPLNYLDYLGLTTFTISGSLYHRSGDLDLDDRVDGLWNSNAHNYPITNYQLEVMGECDDDGNLVGAVDFLTVDSSQYAFKIAKESKSGIVGKNISQTYARISIQGNMATGLSEGLKHGGAMGSSRGGTVGGMIGGLVGMAAGAGHTVDVEAKVEILVRVSCGCSEGLVEPTITILIDKHTTTGDNYWSTHR